MCALFKEFFEVIGVQKEILAIAGLSSHGNVCALDRPSEARRSDHIAAKQQFSRN
jgi:hypothetical protein